MTEKPNEKSKTSNNLKHIPKDAQVIMSIMKDMDIAEYEPRVINQLLEFTYRYVTCILDDARTYAKHARRKDIDLSDVKLAIDMILENTFTTPPNREILLDLARKKNCTPLPLLKPHAGIRLPPDRYCLSSCNYKMKSSSKKQIKVMPTFNNPSGLKGSQKGISVSTVLKRNTIQSMGKSQTVTTVPKPVIKFSTTGPQKTIAKPKTQIITATPQMQQIITSNVQANNGSNIITTIPAGSVKDLAKGSIPTIDLDPSSGKRKRDDNEDYDIA